MAETTYDVGREGFLMRPVRGVEEKENAEILKYRADLESRGWHVHDPLRDTNQIDPVGLRICTDNRAAIEAATAVHIWYNQKSVGSRFDFGMAFALRKPIILANPQTVAEFATPGVKSFENIMLTMGLIRRESDGEYVRLRPDTPLSLPITHL